MLNAKARLSLAVWGAILSLTITSCATPRVESEVDKTLLPSEPPKAHRLILEPSQTGFPLRPSQQEVVALTTPETIMTEVEETDAEARIREAAEQHPRVREELGEKFAHFETEVFQDITDVCPSAESGLAQQAPPPAPPSITRLTYFSYALNSTVVVCMRNEEFVSVGQREGYQPPESEDEIEKAERLAREDPRLSGKLVNLRGHAILIEPEAGFFFGWFGDPGAGHRVLWVTFSKQDERDPLYWAVVDLTEDSVLDAGKEEKE